MNNRTPKSTADKITAKRAAVTAAREAHAAAAAAHEAAKVRFAAAEAAAPVPPPGCFRYYTAAEKAARAEADAAHAARIKAFKLITRREIALARLVDTAAAERDTARRAEAATVKPEAAAPALKHDTATLAAAFRTAATGALSDMEAAAARAEVRRAEAAEMEARKRCEAAEAARVAAFNAWKEIREARLAAKPFPLTCPAEAAAWQALQAAEADWSRVMGQCRRHYARNA